LELVSASDLQQRLPLVLLSAQLSALASDSPQPSQLESVLALRWAAEWELDLDRIRPVDMESSLASASASASD
jgi:hypothetical protein